MNPLLPLLLRLAGAGLILLALLHVPIGHKLRWAEDCKNLTPANAAIFRVHTFFICLVLVMMGAPSLLEPGVLLNPSRAGGWLAWSITGFWTARLYCQWFVYRAELWRGKRMETAIHWIFTFVWLALATVFGLCGCVQAGWLAL